MQINDEFLQAVVNAVKEAGAMIEAIAKDGFETRFKAAKDPVTTADLAANELLHKRLLALLPEAGWLSEETRDSDARLAKEWVWIVDPIDGTKEFVKRVPNYAVSVALAQNGEVILGVVYNPARDDCFAGLKNVGVWLNEIAVRAEYADADQGKIKVLGSRSEIRRGEFDRFTNDCDIEPVGSIAYKLALLAAGRAQATWSLGPKNEWDIAAGVLLVQAAGGKVVDPAGLEFVFNRKDTLVEGVVAATTADFERVMGMIG